MKRVIIHPLSIVLLLVMVLTAVWLSPAPALQAQDAQPVAQPEPEAPAGQGVDNTQVDLLDADSNLNAVPTSDKTTTTFNPFGSPTYHPPGEATESVSIPVETGPATPSAKNAVAGANSPTTLTNLTCGTGVGGPYGACGSWGVNDYQDISSTGITITTLTEDYTSFTLYFGYQFAFFGTDYDHVYVNPNGTFTFGSSSSAWNPDNPLPNATDPDNLIAAYWEDLSPQPSRGGTVHYQHFGVSPYRYTVVQFQDVPHYNSTTARVSFQIKFYETSDHFQISYIRADDDNDGEETVIGYENSNGGWGYNSFYADSGVNTPVTLTYYKPQWAANDGCFAKLMTTGQVWGTDGNYYSDAIQNAVWAAQAHGNTNHNIRLAGHCSVRTIGTETHTMFFLNGKNINFYGGYTKADGFATSNPAATPTIINGMGQYRISMMSNGTYVFYDTIMMRGNSAYTWADDPPNLNDNRAGSLFVNSTASVYFNDSIIAHSRSNQGGAIQNNGWFRLNEDARILENSSTGNGGGIANFGTLLVYEANVNNNTAADSGGGILNGTGDSLTLQGTGTSIADLALMEYNEADFGAAIYNQGSLSLNNYVNIRWNTATTSGGGIYNDPTGTTTFNNGGTNQFIYDNTAAYGGGIYSQGTISSSCSSTDCYDIIENTATNSGGGLYLSNATATNLYRIHIGKESWSAGNTAVHGAGLYNYLSTVTLNQTTIQYNGASGNGGGILNYNGTLNSSNSTLIQYNTANTGSGGGLSNEGGSALANLDNTQFNDNDAINGGGIWNDGGTLDIDGGSIHHGTATTAGGGIRNFGNGTVDIDDNNIYSNSAPNGGGIYATNGTFRVNVDVNIYSNSATAGNGGGIYNAGSFFTVWNESEVYSNSATGNGGGVYNASTFVTERSVIRNNSAVNGAGIYNDSYTRLQLNAAVRSNIASGNGGGIYNAASGDTLILQSNNEIGSNEADNGGGIYNNGGSVTLQTSANIDNNEALNGHGGGIYNSNGTLTSSSSSSAIVQNNTASDQGGGIYNFGGTITLNDSRVWFNTATNSGGGIRTTNGATINNSHFNGNQTTNSWGGGIYSNGGTAAIYQSHFVGNHANSDGGAIASGSSSTLNVTESTFDGNYAPTGGALWVAGNGGSVVNSTFSGNYHPVSGTNQGGAILNYSSLAVINSTFTGNGLNGTAGADIYNNDALTLNSSLLANSAGTTNCVNTNILTNSGGNLIEDGSCSTEVPDAITGDPKLLALAANGGGATPSGTVPTHMLGSGSPAVNNGNCNNGTLATSQNGVARLNTYPQFCDIGAVEFLAVGTPLLDIGRDFRRMDVTQNASTGTQAVNIPLNEIDKNFSDYDGGQLFDRFCIDFGQLQTDLALGNETDCTVWNGGVSPGGNADISAGGSRSVNVYNTLRNSVGIQQEQAFRNSLFDPPQVGQSISDTLDAIREIHYTGMIYANEFYADAIRYQLYFTPTNNVDGINNEIGLMEQAYTQYNIVANSMALLGERELHGGKTVSNYYNAEDFEMFALATTRQADVALEIAQRLQKIDPIANSETAADRLNAEYVKQQRNLEIFIAWLNANYPEPTYNDVQREAIYENNRGRDIAIGMEKLSRWADDIRSSDNPFGYPNEYVPRTTYITMRDRTMSIPTVNSSPFGLARIAEEAARNEARAFEENDTSMTLALTALNEEFEAQRLDLCGIEASGNWTDPCDGGAMARNREELVAAARGVDLAYQQVANFSQLILIEQERVGAVTIELSNAGQTISLAQLQIGKLNSIQQVTTDFVTDQESERTGTRAEAKVTNRTTVTVSSDPFENGAKNETEVEASVATWTETESETTTGTTQETIRNPNLEKIAEQESRQLLREWESQATIENANSSAEIKRLLLEQSDALISLDIATAEFNAVLADHNLLVAQWEDLQGDYPDALANFQLYFDRPSRRLIHDATSADFNVAFANLQNYAYLTAKALEYDLLDPSLIPYNDLYRARRVNDIQTFMNTLESLYGSIGYDFDTDSLTTRYVSVVTDVVGLTTDYLTTLIVSDTFTVDSLAAGWPSLPQCAGPTFTLAQLEDLRFCLFQEYLNNNLDGDIYELPFSTEIGRIYDSFTWNARITNSSDDNLACPLCNGVSIDMRTTQTGIGTPPVVRLNYLGMGTYLNADEEVVRYRPGPARLVGQAIPNGFPNTSTSQVASTFVNGGGGGTEESGFFLLSAVNNSWRLDMDRTSLSNQGVDFSKITDFVISIQIEVKTVPGSRRAELEAIIEQAQLNRRPIDSAILDEYAAIKAQPYQPAPFTAAEKELLAEMFAIMAPDTITQTTYIDPLVPHGAYQGSMVAMGFAELGVIITATDELSVSQPLIGSLCVTCSVLYTAQPLTGYFTNTGTLTNTFFLASAPIPMVVDGPVTGTVQITKTYIFEGLVIDGGNVISGTYREVTTDTKGVVGTTYVGTFSMSRWDRTPGAVTPIVSLSVGPGGFPSISWGNPAENCTYQLYHSRNPYFVNYSRQLATTTAGTSYIDTSAAAVDQPLFYSLRGFSCSANLDYLQQDASFYKDSTTTGVFVFPITP